MVLLFSHKIFFNIYEGTMKHMIRLIFCLFMCIYNIYAEPHINYNSILVVVLMVKNEETVMRATLQPFIDGGISSFFIFDTGSTDNTIGVTESFFVAHGITQGYIAQEPFI